MVAAQVHSHPDEAFHSKGDDEWAIVRHEGALSIVVPTSRGTYLRWHSSTRSPFLP